MGPLASMCMAHVGDACQTSPPVLAEREEMGVRLDPGAEAAAPVGASLQVGHAPTATDVFELLVGQLIALFPDQGQDILGRLARVRLGLLLFG